MTEPVYKKLGHRIRMMRCGLGMTQGSYAKKVGLNRTSIVNIEAGRQRILLHQVRKFAAALGIIPAALIRGIWK